MGIKLQTAAILWWLNLQWPNPCTFILPTELLLMRTYTYLTTAVAYLVPGAFLHYRL